MPQEEDPDQLVGPLGYCPGETEAGVGSLESLAERE
jgi:hypothetical protein